MPDFEHFRFSYSRMNPVLGESGFQQNLQAPMMMVQSDSEPGYFLEDHSGFGPDGLSGLDLAYLQHRAPPAATALRNDLGSNISVLKTLNLRFRCFLAKVHELERRNKVLEKQLQQALGEGDHQRALTKDASVQTGFIGPITARPGFIPVHNSNSATYLPDGLLSPTLNNQNLLHPDTNSNLLLSPALSPSPDLSRTFANINNTPSSAPLTPPPPPPPRFLPGNMWTFNPSRRFSSSRDSNLSRPAFSWIQPDGIGVQIDTITPEIRALYNVLSKVKRERDQFKTRWEEEYRARLELQDRVEELEEDLQESEVCQDELSLRVKQLKSELVLFKGLVSNNLSELESRIQEKAMKVDMDICRRIDITARLCDVAQQRNSQETVFTMTTPPSTLSRRVRKPSGQSAKSSDGDEANAADSEGGGGARREGASASQVNEQLHKIQLDYGSEDDSDSLVWEESDETLLLWEDFTTHTHTEQQQRDESIEKVINETESLFESREKEYQETIGQIELELATAKSDMNRHLHEYMEMCSMKRGLDVQMETCRRLITHSGQRKSSFVAAVTANDETEDRERQKTPMLSDDAEINEPLCAASAAVPPLTWRKP